MKLYFTLPRSLELQPDIENNLVSHQGYLFMEGVEALALYRGYFALFCVAILKDSVSLLGFTFLNHVQIFSRIISQDCHFKYPAVFFFPFRSSSFYCFTF